MPTQYEKPREKPCGSRSNRAGVTGGNLGKKEEKRGQPELRGSFLKKRHGFSRIKTDQIRSVVIGENPWLLSG